MNTSLRVVVLCIIMLSTLSAKVEANVQDSLEVSFPDHPVTQLVFFAVFEGLYEDGVSNETIDLIIPPDKENGGYGGYKYTEHFIRGCPMCSPAFEAFKLYRSRDKFSHLKPVGRDPDKYLDTFGKGLDEETINQLKSPDKEVRLKAIEGLINRWVNRRIVLMRLNESEGRTLAEQLEAGKKKGAALLEKFKKDNSYGVESTRLNCAICKGAAEASKGH